MITQASHVYCIRITCTGGWRGSKVQRYRCTWGCERPNIAHASYSLGVALLIMMGLVDEQACYRMFVNHPAQQGRRSRLPGRKEGERVQNLKSSSAGRAGIPYASLGSSLQGYTLRQCINSKDVYSSRVCFPLYVTVLSRVIR